MKTAQHILGSIRRIVDAVDRNNKRVCKPLGLTPAQLICLRELNDAGELAIGALARRVGSSGTTLTGVIDRLEAKGLVQRRRSPLDRRSVRLTITEAGKAALGRLPDGKLDPFFESVESLSRADMDQLDLLLSQIAEQLEVPAARSPSFAGGPARD